MRVRKWIPIANIESVRKPLGPDILRLALHLLHGGTVPPIHVQRRKGRFIVCDGRHRIQAYKLLGRTHILAKYALTPEEELHVISQ